MTRKEYAAELLKAVEKHRISNHCRFEHSAQEAVRILQNHAAPRRRGLLTKSEFLEGVKKPRRGFGWRWWPCVNWRRKAVAR